jgi:transcriptional regulator with XRE-family HTH domain
MSVNLILGGNLRRLCALRPSISLVARELDISKVQFGRYLNSSSFPKPQELSKICDYFKVDARILTDELTDDHLEALRRGAPDRPRFHGEPLGRNFAMEDAINFTCPTQDYFTQPNLPPDGLYLNWRKSCAFEDKYVRLLMQISTIGKSKVMRGRDLGLLYRSVENHHPSSREFRGVVHGLSDGFAFVCYHATPTGTLSVLFFQPAVQISKQFYIGFSVVTRGSYLGKRRSSHCVLEPVDSDFPNLLKLARQSAYVDKDEIPGEFIQFLAKDFENS